MSPTKKTEFKSAEEIKRQLKNYFKGVTRSFGIYDVSFLEYTERITQLYKDYKKTHGDEDPLHLSFLPADQRRQLGLTRTLDSAAFKKSGQLNHYIDAVSEGYLFCLEHDYLIAAGRERDARIALNMANSAYEECREHWALDYHKPQRSERAKKGAEAKFQQNYGDAVELTLQLMIKKKPPAGWSSSTKAATAVAPEVRQFLEERGIAASETNFEETVKQWILKDSRMRQHITRLNKPINDLASGQ